MGSNKKDVVKYNCLNFGGCAKADSKEVIEIDAMDTLNGKPKCPHCHQDTLEEIPEKVFPWKMIAGIAAAVAVIGGGVGFFALGGKDKPAPEPKEPVVVTVDSLQKVNEDSIAKVKADSIAKVKADSIAKAKEDSIAKAKEKEKVDGGKNGSTSVKKQPKGRYQGTLNLGYGTYSGEILNGKPDGAGTLRYTSSHQVVSSKDVYAAAGDRIEGVFENGKPSFVTLYKKDGSTVKIHR